MIPKSTLSQHLKILREAGLIRSERKGVEMINTSRCERGAGADVVMIERSGSHGGVFWREEFR